MSTKRVRKTKVKKKRVLTKNSPKLHGQLRKHSSKKVAKKKKSYDGNTEIMISTGSLLLDLAISGGRVHGGGIPGGVFVEVFGPSGAGKTVMLCEMAGDVQRKGGDVRFDDPEARLNKSFAKIFDLDTDDMDYATPDKVTDVFKNVRKWEPKGNGKINGTFTDSLAALSTDIEMDKEDGDKMGMRRAKEFSEGFRKNARIITQKNYIMACSNQVRENQDAGKYSPKYKSTGGFAIGFYASLRLRASNPQKIYKSIKVAGKEVKKAIGVRTVFEVFKSSVWKPFRSAPVSIIFDYGVDDVRENLQYIKDYTSNKTYMVGGKQAGKKSLENAIRHVEENHLENVLKEEVIELWNAIEEKFNSDTRAKKRRGDE